MSRIYGFVVQHRDLGGSAYIFELTFCLTCGSFSRVIETLGVNTWLMGSIQILTLRLVSTLQRLQRTGTAR